MMRPEFLPLLLILLSLPHPSLSVCVPRNANPIPYLYSTTEAPAEAPEPLVPSSSPTPPPSPPPGPKTSAPPPSVQSVTQAVNNIVQTVSKTVTGVVTSDAGTGALKSICAYTDYPDVCLSSIQSTAASLSTIDAKSVVGLQMKALTDKAQAAMEYGKNFLSDPQYGDCLKDCLDSYDDGVDNVETAKNALLDSDKGTVMSMLSAAYGSFTCADTFSEGEDLGRCKGPSPMKDHDDVLTKLVSNSLAICGHLGH